MARILINGVKANAGGGKVIINNYLALLKSGAGKHKFVVLTPDREEYLQYACDSIEIVDVKNLYKKNILFPLLYYWAFPKLLKKLQIDIIFNFGDIIIPANIPQIYMFDWPYAIYPDCAVWKRMAWKDFFTRKLKAILIKKYIKYPLAVIAQTETVRARLKRYYGLKEVEVIPSAVSLENLEVGDCFDFKLPADKFKLLHPSACSPHKNMGIFISLAKKIKEQGLPYLIIVTIDPGRSKDAKKLMAKVKKEKLEDMILNLGHICMKNIASLYKQSDALLMPTLLESYGLPYVEAMYHKKTVFTSDLDFARDVCGEAAFYFSPVNEDSILETIKKAYLNIEERALKIKEGDNKIKQLLSWKQVFECYQNLLELNIRKLKKAT